MKSNKQRELSITEAAVTVGRSVALLYREMAAGRLQTERRGERRLIPEQALKQWLASRNEIVDGFNSED